MPTLEPEIAPGLKPAERSILQARRVVEATATEEELARIERARPENEKMAAFYAAAVGEVLGRINRDKIMEAIIHKPEERATRRGEPALYSHVLLWIPRFARKNPVNCWSYYGWVDPARLSLKEFCELVKTTDGYRKQREASEQADSSLPGFVLQTLPISLKSDFAQIKDSIADEEKRSGHALLAMFSAGKAAEMICDFKTNKYNQGYVWADRYDAERVNPYFNDDFIRADKVMNHPSLYARARLNAKLRFGL